MGRFYVGGDPRQLGSGDVVVQLRAAADKKKSQVIRRICGLGLDHLRFVLDYAAALALALLYLAHLSLGIKARRQASA